MMGTKARLFTPVTAVSLDELVPANHFYRLLDRVPPLFEALGQPRLTGNWGRLTFETRDDLAPPGDPDLDVLVIDFRGFRSESFLLDSASRTVSETTSGAHSNGSACLPNASAPAS